MPETEDRLKELMNLANCRWRALDGICSLSKVPLCEARGVLKLYSAGLASYFYYLG